MQINRRVNYNPLSEVINKKKFDVLTKSAKVKELLDALLEIELLKVNDKEEYYVSNPYNENIKYL